MPKLPVEDEKALWWTGVGTASRSVVRCAGMQPWLKSTNSEIKYHRNRSFSSRQWFFKYIIAVKIPTELWPSKP